MKLTPALKSWLTQNCSIDEKSEDAVFERAAGDALAEGKLTPAQYAELTIDKKATEANEFVAKFDRIADSLTKLSEQLSKKSEESVETTEEEEEETTKSMVLRIEKKMGNLTRLLADSGSEEDTDGEKDVKIRYKEAAEHYDDTKSALTYPTTTKKGYSHPMAGRPVVDFAAETSHTLNDPSDRDKAVVGAFGKFICAVAQRKSRTLAWMSMPQHEKELIMYAMENMPWCGASDGGDFADIVNQKLTNVQRKALIDDTTSGGIEAVPLVFDDMIVAAPILNGELYPLVNVVPLDKGRRIQGAKAGTITASWGGVDDTDISLFSTASYISAFDTTVYRWEGAIRIGLDFMSDTPIDFSAFLTQQYGETLLNDLDDVIATGDGTTQPEGITVKTGTTSVAWGGATSIGNYESLRFGVHKREHTPAMMRTAVFCGTDTSYQRALAIPVGTSDARRLSNTQNMPNYDGYTWMGRPYKINESLANSDIFYAILGRYRMYRRRGLTIRSSTEGDTLIRKNEMLLVATARYGGQLERGACAAVTSTAPA